MFHLSRHQSDTKKKDIISWGQHSPKQKCHFKFTVMGLIALILASEEFVGKVWLSLLCTVLFKAVCMTDTSNKRNILINEFGGYCLVIVNIELLDKSCIFCIGVRGK